MRHGQAQGCPPHRDLPKWMEVLAKGTVFLVFIDVRLVGEPINSIMLTEISHVILSLMFKRDVRIETKEWQEEGIGAGHHGRSNWRRRK